MGTETPHKHPLDEGSLYVDTLAKNLKNDPFETHNIDAIRWVLETLKLQHFKVGDWKQVQKTLEALSLVIKENKDVFGTGIHALFFDAAFAYAPHIALTSPSEHAVDLKNRLDALLVQAQQTVANHALMVALGSKIGSAGLATLNKLLQRGVDIPLEMRSLVLLDAHKLGTGQKHAALSKELAQGEIDLAPLVEPLIALARDHEKAVMRFIETRPLPKALKTHLEKEIALKKVASDSTQAAPQSRLPSKINWSLGVFGGFAKRVPAEEEMELGVERTDKSSNYSRQ